MSISGRFANLVQRERGCATHLAVDGLGVRQLAHGVAQGVALAHVNGVQLSVAQLAQARALQVGLAQAGRRAVAHHTP